MHEMSIASEIADCLLRIAAEYRATRIGEVVVEIGRMRQVVPEALEMAFTAEGAVLKTVETAVTAVCNSCGASYSPDIDVSFVCPSCGQANLRITAGDDIIVRDITCDADEGVSA